MRGRPRRWRIWGLKRPTRGFWERVSGRGHAAQPPGEVSPVRVATTGVFEFDCPAGTFELGDVLGVDENGTGDALLNQQVDGVASETCAIGRVARRLADAATSVLVDIRSTVMTGGV